MVGKMYFSGLVSSLSLKKRIETVQFLIPFVGTNSASEGSGVQGTIRNNPGKFNIQVRVRRFTVALSGPATYHRRDSTAGTVLEPEWLL